MEMTSAASARRGSLTYVENRELSPAKVGGIAVIQSRVILVASAEGPFRSEQHHHTCAQCRACRGRAAGHAPVHSLPLLQSTADLASAARRGSHAGPHR